MNPFNVINSHIDHFLSKNITGSVWFASHTESYPENAFLVKFPRAIYVLDGHYKTAIGLQGDYKEIVAQAGDVIYIPAQTWDLPDWSTQSRALTILFGHYQIGMSLTESDQAGNLKVEKATIAEPLQHEGFYLEKSLGDLAISQRKSSAVSCIAEGLLRYCREKTTPGITPINVLLLINGEP